MLIKELQSLALDVRVLDSDGNEIDLKQNLDEETSTRSVENGSYQGSSISGSPENDDELDWGEKFIKSRQKRGDAFGDEEFFDDDDDFDDEFGDGLDDDIDADIERELLNSGYYESSENDDLSFDDE